jgi:hypothetical protein
VLSWESLSPRRTMPDAQPTLQHRRRTHRLSPAAKGVKHNPFAALPGPVLNYTSRDRSTDHQNKTGVRFLQRELEHVSAGVVLDLAECVSFDSVFNSILPASLTGCLYECGICRAHRAEDVAGGVRSAWGTWRDQKVAQQHLDHVARVNHRWPAQGVDAGHVSRADQGETPHSRRSMVGQLTGSKSAACVPYFPVTSMSRHRLYNDVQLYSNSLYSGFLVTDTGNLGFADRGLGHLNYYLGA